MRNRLDRAIALRDHAVRVAGAVGQVLTIGEQRHTILDSAPWRIALISPLGKGSSRASLSIWRVTRVLLIEWDAADPMNIDVPNFRQSDWEVDFLAWVRRT